LKFWDVAFLSAQGLSERKFRFVLNLIGILIGCAAVTGLISLTQGLKYEVNDQLEFFGPQNIMVIPGQIQAGQGIVGYSFSWRDLEIIRKIPHVEIATPIIGNKIAQLDVRGKEYSYIVYGVYPEYFTIFKSFELADGRSISRGDGALAVIGAKVAHPDDEDEPIIDLGDRIRLKVRVEGEEREMVFRVIGISKEIGGTFGSDEDSSIVIPLRVCQQLYDVGGDFEFIAATVDDLEYLDEVVEKIEDKISDSIMVMTQESIQEIVGDVLGTIEAVLGGIAAISLVVAGVGIINTMTISVMERTREIGILKAIGAKSRDVLLMFISEAMITGIVGGGIGALLGMLLSNVVGRFINLPAATSFNLGIGVVAFAAIVGTISGLYPAWRASSLNPVEALRYE